MNNYNLRLICLLLFIIFAFSTSAQTKELTWNYPVRPGTEQWKHLKSFSERLNSFNVPDYILTEMTTENLVKTCLNYPWWVLITSKDNNQAGYDFLKAVFNGFRELENRKDAGKELLKIYERTNPSKVEMFNTSVEKGHYIFQITYIEILLSQPAILDNLSNQDLTSLIVKTKFVYDSKTSFKEKYSMYGISSTCLIMGRILDMTKSKEYNQIKGSFADFDQFIKTGRTSNKELLEKITPSTINRVID